ncbi:MAG TPA: WYL domain-containing protein, partial [Kribbella sp.]|nr:WYL domain-containing protein [Kribbella sp.]
GWDDRRETPRWLDLCRQAVWEERHLKITYGDGAEPFAVSPLGLVAKARTWYLVAARTDGRLRTYRLSRVTSAELTNDPFTRPPRFDLATYWAQSQREFQASRPSYPIVLKVRDHAVRRFRPIEPMVPAADGWWIVHADLESPHEAQAAVLAQAGAAQVIAPAELITLVHEAAQQLADRHRQA